jgi:hypothetical protein
VPRFTTDILGIYYFGSEGPDEHGSAGILGVDVRTEDDQAGQGQCRRGVVTTDLKLVGGPGFEPVASRSRTSGGVVELRTDRPETVTWVEPSLMLWLLVIGVNAH